MDKNKSIQDQIRDWAEKAVEKFNEEEFNEEEFKKINVGYYQQSPLNIINRPIDTLVCGINPGSGSSWHALSAEEFLEGNKDWGNRFVSEEEGAGISKKWAKYFGEAHDFICNDKVRHNNGFDDDTKTVWTNLTPFATPDTSRLTKLIYKESIPYTLRLIKILKPKKIILLGFNSFEKILKYHGDESIDVAVVPIVRDRLENGVLKIGTIEGIPAIQLPHPSRRWNFHKFFVPIFVKMWEQIVNEKRPFSETANRIRTQLTRLEAIEN